MKTNISSKTFIIITLSLVVFLVSNTDTYSQAASKQVNNVILFIGDGMGTSHVYGAISVSDHKLFLETFPYTGFSKTYSASNYVTDSGAGGTAIACGAKTRNGMVGMSPDSVPISSILEIAHKNGLATGIVVTSSLTDATPADFIAHTINRGNYETIAKAYLDGMADVFIGGGEHDFRHRKDNVDITGQLKQQGYDVVYNIDTLKMSKSSKIAGLLAMGDMPAITDGRTIRLSDMTRKAIETLSKNKKGFFLMVEGSLIDKKAHVRNLNGVLNEVLDLDDAIGVAREFAEKNQKTLIVVTADHETGGLALVNGDIAGHQVSANFIESGSHTGVMVPVYSYGPAAAQFSGIHENTFFFYKFMTLLNLRK